MTTPAPCPWCGGTDVFADRADICTYQAVCNDCGAHGPPMTFLDYEWASDDAWPNGDAIAAWNARHPEPIPQPTPEPNSPDGTNVAEAPIVDLCDRCGSEGRIIVADGTWPDGSLRERDCGECPDCKGEGLVVLPGAPRDKWDVFALHDHFDEAFDACSNEEVAPSHNAGEGNG